MNVSIVPILVSAGLFIFAVYKLYSVIKLSRTITASQTWPAVMGQVTAKNVLVHRSSKGSTSYSPEVAYKYSVMGSEFGGKTQLKGLWSRNSAQAALDAMGETMEVRYNPDNPKNHTHGKEKVHIFDILIILASLAIALFLLVPLFMK
jgi:hypothetical protein